MRVIKVTALVLVCALCYQSGLTVAKLLQNGSTTLESKVDGLIWDAITATEGKGNLTRFYGIICESAYEYKLPNTICEDDDLHSDVKHTVNMCKQESLQDNAFTQNYGHGQAFIECMIANYWVSNATS